jgi:HSP20 family protein
MSEKNVPVKVENRPAYRPMAMFDELVNEIDQLWHRPWLGNLPWTARRIEKEGFNFMPRIEVLKKDDALIVKADLPGMKREDIHVALEEGDLVVKGERKEETKVEKDDYYKAECMYGSFYRRVPLGFEVKPDNIVAKLVDGVLEVTVAIPPTVKPEVKEIAIN